MTTILFICSRNACRSQMAEGFARARNEPDVTIVSAGTQATQVHPLAIRVMSETGIDISEHKSKSLSDVNSLDFDIVISLCEQASRECPVLPGNPEQVHWNLPNPAAAADDEEAALSVFRNARDDIRRLVDDFFVHGYLPALAGSRRHAALILNNISDGIIAHDMERNIFHFNKAAELITGYTREEVMNRDCHEAFPGRFCGGKCHFCEGAPPPAGDIIHQDQEIVTKSGEKRFLEMTIRKMVDNDGKERGILAAFKDITRERQLSRRLGEVASFSGIIGRDHKMLEVFDLVRDLADSNVPVLIQGDSGTGKELIAAAIHNEGHRANNLFVPVNCAALPEFLLESELFGHVKGAFTGAIRDKKGRFELADGGTIFLDEIGDIPPAMQVRLLRVLQEGKFERVGSETTITSDVRLVSATNKDLATEINEGRFREDLYYRLNVVPIVLPPLRERPNDIPLIVQHVLERELVNAGKEDISVADETLDIMLSHNWPGNVRELQNWIQFALVKCKGNKIRPEHLPPGLGLGIDPPTTDRHVKRRRRRKLNIAAVREALRETDNNRLAAAKLLAVSRATLYRFLDDMGDDL